MTTTGQLGTPLSSPGLIALGGGAPTQMTLMMRALASVIDTAGLVAQVYDFPVENITVPCVVIGYPTTWDFDMVMGSVGVGTAVFPLWFVIGKTNTEDGRNLLSDVMSQAGSIKDLIDACTAYDVRVTEATVTEMTVGGVPYLAAKFDCEVLG
jgi:hypothetical protein